MDSSSPKFFDRVTRAIGILNTLKLAPVPFGPLQVRYLHWGVTPPAYWLSRRHPNPCQTHKHPYYEICHAFAGEGTFTCFDPDQESKVVEGDTFFARPGLVHHYGARMENPLGICFWSFAIENRNRVKAAPGSRSAQMLLQATNGGPLVVRNNVRASSALSLIIEEAFDSACTERLAPLLQYLALSIGETNLPLEDYPALPARETSAPSIGKIGQFIQDNCQRKLHISDVAERCGYSQRHLTRLFKAQFGESFSDYLLRVRIQTASHLLLDDSFTLKQVARKAGFNSMPAFVRSFRRFTGTPPGEYRRRSLGAAR
jgi:AraC-like DNA-binding protein